MPTTSQRTSAFTESVIRFHFAKRKETLFSGGERLLQLREKVRNHQRAG